MAYCYCVEFLAFIISCFFHTFTLCLLSHSFFRVLSLSCAGFCFWGSRCKLNFQQKTLSRISTVSHYLLANSSVAVLAMCRTHRNHINSRRKKKGKPACISLAEIQRQRRKQDASLSFLLFLHVRRWPSAHCIVRLLIQRVSN